MPRLSYNELFDVYQSGNSEASPERWILVTTDLAARVTELSAGGRSVFAEAYPARDPRYPSTITHIGRCDYSAQVTGHRNAALLVSQETGRQYLVVAVRQGARQRGGNPALGLSLSWQNPPFSDLRRT